MGLRVQDNQGSVADANGYITLVEFKAYHDDRGNDYSASDDAAIEQAIVKATDYLDARYRFIGWKRAKDQATAWPRYDARDSNGDYQDGIPQVLKDATAEMAFRALSGDIIPDPDYDATGQQVAATSTKAGPITDTVEYRVTPGHVNTPAYPKVEGMLKRLGLITSGMSSQVVRG